MKALRRNFPLETITVSAAMGTWWSVANATDVNTNRKASVLTLNNYLWTSSSA